MLNPHQEEVKATTQRKKNGLFIGIDPDTVKSGVGVVRIGEDGSVTVECCTLALPELVDRLRTYASSAQGGVHIVIEAGWLNAGNWHLHPRDSRQMAAAKGRQAGRNHQLGLDLCSLLDHHDVPHSEVAPLCKCWRGPDRKITHEELHTIIANGGGAGMPRRRSNQEERDALLLAWVHSGLPLKC